MRLLRSLLIDGPLRPYRSRRPLPSPPWRGVVREEVEHNLSAHGSDWCERLAERIDAISVDTSARP